MGRCPKSVIVKNGTWVSDLSLKGEVGEPCAVLKSLQSYTVEEGVMPLVVPQSRPGTSKWMSWGLNTKK